jgi:hypothetical protein
MAFGTAYGGFGSYPTVIAINVNNASGNATGGKLTVPSGWQGRVDISRAFGICSTAIVNKTTSGSITVYVNSSAIGYINFLDGGSIGDVTAFTPNTGFESGCVLTPTDYVLIDGRAGTGGSVAGSYTVYVPVQISSKSK